MDKESQYILMAGAEPSDEQLDLLMKEVNEDVKSRALIAEERFKVLMQENVKAALAKYKK